MVHSRVELHHFLNLINATGKSGINSILMFFPPVEQLQKKPTQSTWNDTKNYKFAE